MQGSGVVLAFNIDLLCVHHDLTTLQRQKDRKNQHSGNEDSLAGSELRGPS
jgi:hypothetical protein